MTATTSGPAGTDHPAERPSERLTPTVSGSASLSHSSTPPQPTPVIEVRAEAIPGAAARLDAAGATAPSAGGVFDATLLTPDQLALPGVAAAVQEYLEVRAQRHNQLRTHLCSAASALRRNEERYASTEQAISGVMESVSASEFPARRRSV